MKKCEGIYSLIGKVNHKSVIYGFELLKEENIHPRQMPLIIHLKKCEGCTQKELAEKMQVKPSTLNVKIGRMEKNGYIEKKRLLNKFCDCLDEQTEILKKERKEKSDA